MSAVVEADGTTRMENGDKERFERILKDKSDTVSLIRIGAGFMADSMSIFRGI